MMKRIISLALTLVMLLTLLPILPMRAEAAETSDVRQNIVRLALSQLNYHERGDNWTKYGRWYGMDPAPWCAIFVSWCARMSGVSEDVIPNFASCHSGGVYWFKNHGLWKDRSYTPTAGDIVFFDFPDSDTGRRDGLSDHVGIVISADENYVYTVEGNTSPDSVSDGKVDTKTRTRDYTILGYGVPNYAEISDKSCEISLDGLSYPEIMWKGEAYSVSGTVKSDYAINWLYADIQNENGKHYSYGYCTPGTSSANVSLLANSLKFASLSTGSYYLYIEAIDSEYNFNSWKIPFTVYKSGYDIKYDTLGGTPTPQTQKKLADTAVTLSTSVPQLDDCIFLGWSATKDSGRVDYAPGAEYTANASVTLYAVWQRCNHDFKNGVCTLCDQKLVFRDVDANGSHKCYADAIYWAVDKEITNGVGDRMFEPDSACTRAQTVTFLWRALGHPEASDTEISFSDVKNEGVMTHYYDAILWATGAGVIKGYPEGDFKPNDTCTRAQFVTMLWRAVGSPEPTIENPFEDVTENDYYKAILWAYENNIAQGIGDGLFAPDDQCTRAHVVTFIYRYFAE